MTLTDEKNIFKVPSIEADKDERSKDYTLTDAEKDPQEALKIFQSLCKRYFFDPTQQSLMDQSKCVMTVLQLMSNYKNRMQYLSHFIVICFMFTYSNPQTQSHAITLLKNSINTNFQFSNDEYERIIRVILKNPPKKDHLSFCIQFIVFVCKRSQSCIRFIVSLKNQSSSFTSEQASFLNAISKKILNELPQYLDAKDIEILEKDIIAIPASDSNRNIYTPTEANIESLQNKEKIKSAQTKFASFGKVFYLSITISVILLLIALRLV